MLFRKIPTILHFLHTHVWTLQNPLLEQTWFQCGGFNIN